MSRRSRPLALLAAGVLAAFACTRSRSEPPPPEDKLTLASAAPGAVGALAAGTDAAPPPPSRPRRTWAVPGDEAEDEYPDPEELDGGSPDAAVIEPKSQDLPL